MRILIIDDSAMMRKIIRRSLDQGGIAYTDVIEAKNGSGGLTSILGCAPDLVLCDLHMPDMDGMTLLNRVRESGNDVPFGIITSDHTEDVRAAAAKAGAGFLLTKPFTPDQLKGHIAELVP